MLIKSADCPKRLGGGGAGYYFKERERETKDLQLLDRFEKWVEMKRVELNNVKFSSWMGKSENHKHRMRETRFGICSCGKDLDILVNHKLNMSQDI